jgi:hypothetical protein
MAYRNHRNAASWPSIYQAVTDRIMSSLKAGVIPWEKPWRSPRYVGGSFPRNFYTGKPYRGINVLLLWSSEYSSPFWLTFKQAQALKGSVRKGEHGTPIVFYKQLPGYAKNDEEGTGEDERVRFVLCHYAIRISDAVMFRREKLKRGKLFLRQQKTGQPVWVPLPPLSSKRSGPVMRGTSISSIRRLELQIARLRNGSNA